MWKNTLLSLLLVFLVELSNAVFVVEINKLFKLCPKSMSPFPWDASELQIFLSEDDKLIMNGRLTVVSDIYPPFGFNIYAQKQEQGEWVLTPYGKQVLNLCGLMLSQNDMWYSVTQHLNKSTCPLLKGHVETFDMVELDNFGLEDVLPDLVGDWRIFMESSLGTVPHRLQMSCVVSEVSVIEH